MHIRRPETPLTVRIFEVQLHVDGGVFEDQRGGLDQDGLSRRKLADEHITRGMKQ